MSFCCFSKASNPQRSNTGKENSLDLHSSVAQIAWQWGGKRGCISNGTLQHACLHTGPVCKRDPCANRGTIVPGVCLCVRRVCDLDLRALTQCWVVDLLTFPQQVNTLDLDSPILCVSFHVYMCVCVDVCV